MEPRRQVRVGCEFRYTAAIDTPAVFQVQPYDAGPAVVRTQTWSGEPEVLRHGYSDLYGNPCQRLTLPAGSATLRFDALVTVPDATEEVNPDARESPVADLPDEVLLYTLPSRYVLSDELGDHAWDTFGSTPPGYGRVQAVLDHVHDSLTFRYGASSATTTAVDVWTAKEGVCRDFAHVSLSFLRALNIPARYVFGYLPDLDVPPAGEPMDFAAWIEVWLDGTWYTFDPRNNTPRKGRVLIGRGRDALDVAMVTTYGGPVLESMVVWAEETGTDPTPLPPARGELVADPGAAP
ncbi:MAG: Transglutaminase-like domain [uncultured Corynebacteriales bacterium]|uniref:Transglutaminase-like domain n=1 Tax=uncultured Mycobacteriales bacterium TaxID=581187 RepID=A0A6J4JWY9_9ACTN|nr:MAG: Transglutaminase-like domain [uncultured Corynebacteriales bacterium]